MVERKRKSAKERQDKLKERTGRSIEDVQIDRARNKQKGIEAKAAKQKKDPNSCRRGPSKKDGIPEEGTYPKRHTFINIPMEMVVSRIKFSAADFAVYGYIGCFTKYGLFFTNRAIAEDLKLSKDTVDRSIRKLRKWGLITSESFSRRSRRKIKTIYGNSGRTLKLTKDFSKIGVLKHEEKGKGKKV